jgi:hypothetical protein
MNSFPHLPLRAPFAAVSLKAPCMRISLYLLPKRRANAGLGLGARLTIYVRYEQ